MRLFVTAIHVRTGQHKAGADWAHSIRTTLAALHDVIGHLLNFLSWRKARLGGGWEGEGGRPTRSSPTHSKHDKMDSSALQECSNESHSMLCLAVATEAPRDLKKPVSLSTSYRSLQPRRNSATSTLPAQPSCVDCHMQTQQWCYLTNFCAATASAAVQNLGAQAAHSPIAVSHVGCVS